nr:hypothetical protein [Tanacetum cinerariifolium]
MRDHTTVPQRLSTLASLATSLHYDITFTYQWDQFRTDNEYSMNTLNPRVKFPLAKEVPTASEESSHCQKKRDATAEKIALLLKLSSNCQSKSYDNYANKYKTAQELWAAILKTFGGDRQSTAVMDLEIEQDDLNQKFLTSLALKWLMHTIVWRNMSDLNTMSLDDLYNHLKVYESEVQKKSEPNPQNMDFISSAKHSSGNEEVNTTSVSTASANIRVATISQDTACAYIASQSSGSQIKFEDINQIDEDDMEEMDIKWNMALLNMRADRFWKKTGKKISIQGTNVAGFDKSKTGLPEFKDDTATDYSRPSPTIESTSDDAQNRNPSVTKTEASPSTILPKPFIKFVKANDSPTKSKIDKVETAKKPPAKYVEQYRKPTNKPNVKGNKRNWNNLKSHQLDPNFMMKKKACFNYGDFNHFAYDCSKRVKKGTSRSQNNTHKNFTPRPTVHKPYRPPMRPMRSNMNAARPNRTSFNKPSHSYIRRRFQRISAVRSQYKAPWGHTVNRNFHSIDRKFYTISRNVSNGNRKFLTANRKFPTGSIKFSTADLGKKENAVKASAGLPSKCFENDHTCSACLKGKQRKAS